MSNLLNDPVAIGLALLGVVLFVGSYAIDWQKNWEKEQASKSLH